MNSKKSLSYEQLKKNRWFLVALTLGLVILIVAIFIELVQSQTKSQVDPKLKKYALPLSPTFNEAVFQKLDTLTYLSPQEVREQVSRLPVRVIDRETKQIITLKSDGSKVASSSARVEDPNNRAATESGEITNDNGEALETVIPTGDTADQENEQIVTP